MALVILGRYVRKIHRFALASMALEIAVDLLFLCTGRELGDGLGSLRHGVLGQFPGKHEAYCGLNFAAAERGFFVVRGKLSRFRRNALKNVLNERVHDGHALFGNTSVGVDLLEDLVNVAAVRFRALFGLFGTTRGGFLGRGFARGLLRWCWCLTHGWMLLLLRYLIVARRRLG